MPHLIEFAGVAEGAKEDSKAPEIVPSGEGQTKASTDNVVPAEGQVKPSSAPSASGADVTAPDPSRNKSEQAVGGLKLPDKVH